MIKLGYLEETRYIEFKKTDLKILMVRKLINGIPFGFKHMPILSPSIELLEDAKRWKNNDYTQVELEILKKMSVQISSDSWWDLYKSRFKEEFQSNEVKEALEYLEKESKNRDVYLFSYSKDINICHRLIVGDELTKRGLRVDYRKYTSNKEFLNQVTFFEDF